MIGVANPDRGEAQNRLVLKILNGTQQGVEVPLQAGRWIIGNDPANCDFVVETGSIGEHVMILTVSDESATVKPMHGALWLGEQALQGLAARPTQALQAFTLGRVSLAFGHEGADFESIVLPDVLRRPGEDAALASTPLYPKDHWAGKARRAVGGIIIAFSVLMVAGLGAMLAVNWRDHSMPGDEAMLRLASGIQTSLARTHLNEVRIDIDTNSSRLLARGYVADQAGLDQLAEIVAEAELPTDVSVVRVDTLQRALAGRLSHESLPAAVSYEGGGRFGAEVAAVQYHKLLTMAGNTFRDLTALKTLEVTIHDIVDPDTSQPVVVSVERMPGSLGKIQVAGDNLPMLSMDGTSEMFVELRTGAVPSAVTRSGQRLFVGAKLKDGSLIQKIDAKGVVIAKAGASRLIQIAGQGSLVAVPAKYRVANMRKYTAQVSPDLSVVSAGPLLRTGRGQSNN